MVFGLFIAAASGVVAALGVGLVWRHARRLGLIQEPNVRSSHLRATPTGGGIGIVLGAIFAGIFAVGGEPRVVPVVLLTSIGFAALGLWDDLRPLPALVRLAVQLILVAVTLVVAMSAWSPESGIGGATALGCALITLLVVYWVNLYNFMDGIDGVAGSEALFLLLTPLGLALVSTPASTANPLFWWPVGIAAAVAAFLRLNWAPAKIFMGDVGSTFLGFLIAVFAIFEISSGWLSLSAALILPACFLTDGTLTLLRRVLQGENIATAHRRHAYQHMARRFGSHSRVVLAMTAINLLWLLPLAILAQTAPALAPMLVIIAYAPLALLAFAAGAGRPEHA
ncbi:MAG: glycosyltransferase family 4 protein [Devosia sp.]